VFHYLKFITFGFLILISKLLIGQSAEEKLALSYIDQGECDKAEVLYQRLMKSKILTENAYSPYISCLEKEKDFEKMISVSKYFFSKTQSVLYRVDEAFYLNKSGKEKKSKKLIASLINEAYKSSFKSLELSAALRKKEFYAYAIEVLQKNQDHSGSASKHLVEISQLYYLQGDKEKSLDILLSFSKQGANGYNTVLANLPGYLQDEQDYQLIKKLLIKRIRTEKFTLLYEQLLSWVFVQQKDWNSAFVHYKSISKKENDQGRKVLELARLCTSNEEYDIAAKCYKYVWDLGPNQMNYRRAQSGWLSSRYKSVTKNPYPDSTSLVRLEKDFLEFINSGSRSPYVAMAMRQLSEIYIKYFKSPLKAIELLKKAVLMPTASDKFKAECKLDLGDAYLFMGDVWESELLYAQVQKSYKEDPLGQEARFKKAQLAYYRGEFSWAEKQLEVLKGATTQLISNNAIELALRIQDNLGLDSNYVVMETYAKAELLLFQNRSAEALQEVEKIILLFPKHSLADEVLYLKARVYAQKSNWKFSIANYKELIKLYKNDILYDNALFELANIYENQFKDTVNAMKYYEKLILEQKGSLFVVEASRRYRALRGDVIREQENYYFKP
jgi:tetratricopeptide (TPR) repeat protein